METKKEEFNFNNKQQKDLYNILIDRDKLLAGIYLGALAVLKQNDNTDRYPQAAHSFRELMEKIINNILGIPLIKRKRQNISEKLNEIENGW